MSSAVESLVERLRAVEVGMASMEEHLASGTPGQPPANEAMVKERHDRVERSLTTISGVLDHIGY